METVIVNVEDLGTLAALISDRDYRDQPPTLDNINQSHALVIKMLGAHAPKFYDKNVQAAVA